MLNVLVHRGPLQLFVVLLLVVMLAEGSSQLSLQAVFGPTACAGWLRCTCSSVEIHALGLLPEVLTCIF